MRAVIQRVRRAKVSVDGEITGQIERGLLTLLGVSEDDTSQDVDWMLKKILNLRIFEDDQGKLNLSLLDLRLEHLIVSQFTLYADASKGNRPSFTKAAKPELARNLYDETVNKCRSFGVKTETGRFQASMIVELENDGPVTIILDSPSRSE
jgi:D-aminoacyl-tRNA deacylase